MRFCDEELSLKRGGKTHFATLCAVKNSKTVILIIGGSGVYDKDGVVGETRIGYQEWAYALAEKGYSSLRTQRYNFDDLKSIYQSTYPKLVRQNLVWLNLLSKKYDHIYLLGHSLGGLIALSLAKFKVVSGLFLLATPAQNIQNIIKEQLIAAHASTQDMNEAQVFWDYYLGKAKLRDISSKSARKMAPKIKPMMKTILELSGEQLAIKISMQKIHILQGGIDSQVNSNEASRLFLPFMRTI